MNKEIKRILADLKSHRSEFRQILRHPSLDYCCVAGNEVLFLLFQQNLCQTCKLVCVVLLLHMSQKPIFNIKFLVASLTLFLACEQAPRLGKTKKKTGRGERGKTAFFPSPAPHSATSLAATSFFLFSPATKPVHRQR